MRCAPTQNVRRFLTFHLTDNVAELAPFAPQQERAEGERPVDEPALACRSTRLPVWRLDLRGNPLVLYAVSGTGWLMAIGAGAVLVLVDGIAKSVRRRDQEQG